MILSFYALIFFEPEAYLTIPAPKGTLIIVDFFSPISSVFTTFSYLAKTFFILFPNTLPATTLGMEAAAAACFYYCISNLISLLYYFSMILNSLLLIAASSFRRSSSRRKRSSASSVFSSFLSS